MLNGGESIRLNTWIDQLLLPHTMLLVMLSSHRYIHDEEGVVRPPEACSKHVQVLHCGKVLSA